MPDVVPSLATPAALAAADLLREAVAIPSISGHEREVAHYLVKRMADFADEAFVDEAGNAVARVGRGECRAVFLGHIDTVPGDIPVRHEDGLLYGRGAVDAKGSFCAAVAAASRLPPEVRSSLSLLLIGAVEEEAPSSKGAHHALANYSRPDCLIIGEPSGWDAMTLGYKGRLVARVTLEKDNFHSAGSGPTAAEELVDLWLRVKGWANAFNEDKTGMFDSLQVALQEISSRNDGLMQGADATLGLRLPPTMAPQQAETILRSLLGPASTLTFDGHVPACRAAKDTILSRAFRSAIRQQAGVPRFKLKTGTSDMNLAAQTWDVPMLAYGPGDSTLDHRPDEHLDLAEYERSIRVLQAAFAALAGRA